MTETREEILAAWKDGMKKPTSARIRSRHPKQAKGGKRADLGGVYVRSTYEANIYRYLKFLKSIGCIRDFEYEPCTFTFEAQPDRRVNGKKAPLSGIKFGLGMRYKPDFKVIYEDNTCEFWETKGWTDRLSKTKLRRMRLYHPDVKVVLIDRAAYKAIERDACKSVPNWE